MLVRWRPINDIASIQNDIDRVFDSFLRGQRPAGGPEGWYPVADLKETETEFVLVAELPGVNKDDVKISLTDNVLSLRGEKRGKEETQGETWHQVERTYGSFERFFQLTAPVDAGKIKAKFTDGLLRVTLPKTEEAKPREIKIDF